VLLEIVCRRPLTRDVIDQLPDLLDGVVAVSEQRVLGVDPMRWISFGGAEPRHGQAVIGYPAGF
jgi:hypothetical protein